MDELIVFKKNPKILTRTTEDEITLLPIEASFDQENKIYTLNESAAYVWQLIDGRRTLGDIKKAILKEFDATEEELSKGLNKILEDLKRLGYLLT
jgi:hypothetical protein